MKNPPSSLIAASLIVACSVAVAVLAQDPAVAVPASDLPDEQLESSLVKKHSLLLPSPGELLYVLSKQGSPKWRKLYYPVLQAQESDRTKTALRLGLSIAESHLAAMARDAQKIRDITNDLQRYSKVLGISNGLVESSRSINSAAENKAWASVAFQLEALVTETSDVLRAQRDADLADLITTGLWLRLLHVSSGIVTEKDFSDPSTAISSHWTLQQLITPLVESKEPTVVSARGQLSKIARLWAPEKLAAGHPQDDALIKDSHTRLGNIIQLFNR